MEKPRKILTDEERLKLASKMDKELDEFIDRLEKKHYTEGWPEDRWQEEMEKHPFFMTKTPEPGEELDPLLEGIQQLKYDPDENTPDELAKAYKEDGNFYFKNKNYKMAFYSYTEGIKTKCSKDVMASLYNNRSAASYFLKNYRSCLNDCKTALKLNPNYDKVINRAAHCCSELEDFDKCLEYCDRFLEKYPTDKHIVQLRQKCLNGIIKSKRDARKKEVQEKRYKLQEEKLIQEIISRGIKIEGEKDGLKLENLEPKFPEIVNNRVFLDENNKLVWPVVLLYPEYQIMDFIQQFHEDDRFIDHLQQIFEQPPEWDVTKKYKPENVNLYFENAAIRKVFPVNVQETLGNILKSEKFLLRGGTPSFICFVKDSPTEKNFLKQY